VVVKQVKYVTKRLDRMGATASLKTVKKAEENLVKLADALEADGLVEVGRLPTRVLILAQRMHR
jgi:hypothetical protein